MPRSGHSIPWADQRRPEQIAEDIFTMWHVDEVTGSRAARDYAQRLVARLAASGVGFARVNDNTPEPFDHELGAALDTE